MSFTRIAVIRKHILLPLNDVTVCRGLIGLTLIKLNAYNWRQQKTPFNDYDCCNIYVHDNSVMSVIDLYVQMHVYITRGE